MSSSSTFMRPRRTSQSCCVGFRVGQVVIIAKASKPIARIVPLREATPSGREFGAFKGWIECMPGAFDASDEVADLFESGDVFPD